MTPQLQQAIKLLQLSRIELVDMVREEMLENPILEDSVESANEQAKATAGRQYTAEEPTTSRPTSTSTRSATSTSSSPTTTACPS